MGAAVIAALLAIVPLVSLLPVELGGVADTLLACATLAAAWHGTGQLVARAAGRRTAPLVAIQWGIAAALALGGMAIALHAFHLVRPVLLAAGLVAHAIYVLARRDQLRLAFGPWAVPVALVAVVALVAILGSAGAPIRPFDDDGNVLAQLVRLHATGGLGDAIGYPRMSQLGGALAIAGLAPDPALGLALDRGLGLALALALAVARIRPRDGAGALWASLTVVVASALAFAPGDAAPCWLAVGLAIALVATIDDGITSTRDALPAGLVAGALVALRYELAPFALVALA
ncbi:MAG TPA: hypothetical protein VLX92_32950, partial [Kofleriaceae bacterium]|nr:hypothetical protein [Kofleriaceae bacterium]